jgi:hypothetical protein
MRLGIMQPYFFPYPGHFSLIAHCDEWVVFDITQYTPKSWMNRNRVLHPTGGPNWVGVPLANGSISISTAQARVLDPQAARRSILGKLSHYRRQAPFHAAVEALIDEAFGPGGADDSLTRLDVRGLAAVCRYLEIPFRPRICSELSLDLPVDLGPGDWAPEICARLGARQYLNPAGGRALFDPRRFERLGVDLQFLHTEPPRYAQGSYPPSENLSILDMLMWNPPATVREALLRSARVETA